MTPRVRGINLYQTTVIGEFSGSGFFMHLLSNYAPLRGADELTTRPTMIRCNGNELLREKSARQANRLRFSAYTQIAFS